MCGEKCMKVLDNNNKCLAKVIVRDWYFQN